MAKFSNFNRINSNLLPHISPNKGINLKKMGNSQNMKKMYLLIMKIERMLSKIFFVGKFPRSGGFFIYYYAQLVSYVGIAPKIQI